MYVSGCGRHLLWLGCCGKINVRFIIAELRIANSPYPFREAPRRNSRTIKEILKNIASKIARSALTYGLLKLILMSGAIALPAGQILLILAVFREVCLFAWKYYQYVASTLLIVSSSSSSCRKSKKTASIRPLWVESKKERKKKTKKGKKKEKEKKTTCKYRSLVL